MATLAPNMKQALESELTGLEARLKALGTSDAEADKRARLERRIGEVHDQLGTKPKRGNGRGGAGAKEKRPAGGGTETPETK